MTANNDKQITEEIIMNYDEREKIVAKLKNELVGQEFEYFGYSDLSNEMMEHGFCSMWDDCYPDEEVDDHEWLFSKEVGTGEGADQEFYQVLVIWKYSTSQDEKLAQECVRRYNEDEYFSQDEWRKISITVTDVQEF